MLASKPLKDHRLHNSSQRGREGAVVRLDLEMMLDLIIAYLSDLAMGFHFIVRDWLHGRTSRAQMS